MEDNGEHGQATLDFLWAELIAESYFSNSVIFWGLGEHAESDTGSNG